MTTAEALAYCRIFSIAISQELSKLFLYHTIGVFVQDFHLILTRLSRDLTGATSPLDFEEQNPHR
jgi:hypothetical protein